MKLNIAFLFLFLSSSVLALDLGSTPSSKVRDIASYSDYGNGDVTVRLETVLAGCEAGFWISGDAPGKNTIISILLASKTTNSDVVVHVDKSRLWGGSGENYCHIYRVSN